MTINDNRGNFMLRGLLIVAAFLSVVALVLWLMRKKILINIYTIFAIGRKIKLYDILEKLIVKKDEKRQSKAKTETMWLHTQPVREVGIKGRDGVDLKGYLLEHPSPKRVIIMFHGWHGSWDKDGDLFAKGLYAKRSTILLVEQRAHGHSGGKYIGFGILERYDCLKWIDYINGTIEKIPIYLSGVSMGASTVLMAAGMNLPKRVKGIIADCGFTNPYDMVLLAAKKFVNIKSNLGKMVDAVNSAIKKKAGYDLKEYSTLEAMKKCKIPIFFAHGTGDDFVPFQMTEINYMNCHSRKTLFMGKGAAHTECYKSDPQRYMEELTLFFQW
jgi:hypothetical protein